MPDRVVVMSAYRDRHRVVLPRVVERLDRHLRTHLSELGRIDRISVRAKSIDSFVAKALKEVDGHAKYVDPLNQIQDQVGARVVTFYRSDVASVAEKVRTYYRPIEATEIVPESESEFGYFGMHFVLLLPTDVYGDGVVEAETPRFFELQIKTLFQHAWSEANHDIAYKAMTPLSPEQKRLVAYTSAQAWGADEAFERLRRDLGSSSEANRGAANTNATSTAQPAPVVIPRRARPTARSTSRKRSKRP